MLRRSTARMGYDMWPWPVKLPLKKGGWFRKLNTQQSVATDVKGAQMFGDVVVVAFLLFIDFRIYQHYSSGVYQSKLRHLNGAPPAIIAQDFDFADESKNRKVSRKELDHYRQDYADAKRSGASIESVIFKH